MEGRHQLRRRGPFTFADLIALPLLLIYRKLYGGRLALRMLALFWVTMSAAGLAVEALFSAAGLVPHARPTQVAAPHFQLNYTAALNLIALVALAAMLWLARQRQRFGGARGTPPTPSAGCTSRPQTRRPPGATTSRPSTSALTAARNALTRTRVATSQPSTLPSRWMPQEGPRSIRSAA